MISKKEVYKIAKLARIAIDDRKAEQYAGELNKIFGYMEKLNKIDVSNVEPLTHVHGSKSVYREDQVSESMPIQDTLKNAPDINGQFFRVPIIQDHNVDN